MLSLLVFFPSLFGLSLFLFPKRFLQQGVLWGAGLQLLLSLSLFFLFDPLSPSVQMTERFALLPFFGVDYFLGIDGLSFWYVMLSALLLFLVALSSSPQSPLYFFLLFSLVTFCNGAFLSFDGILFYIFFEMSLLPLFFMIFLWGGGDRVYSAFKFLIYTFFASLFLLGGLLALMLINKNMTGELSASLLDFYNLDLVFIQGNFFSAQSLLFFCFAFAFAVKTPLAPFHTWLPLAHVSAPTGASVFLAAVILKLGTYGWFRFVLPLFPTAAGVYSPLLLFLAVFGLLYSSFLAFAQTDMKKLVAYSSVAHMAFVLIGLFSFNIYGLQGAFYQTLTHGISSAGLFLLVGFIYDRTGERDMRRFGGLAKKAPLFAICFFLITLSSIALPLTGGFVAEFLVLLGSFLSGEFWVWLAIGSLVLTALYMLNMFQKIFFSGESALTQKIKDVRLSEFLYLSPLALLGLVMGIFPGFFFKYSSASLNHLNQWKHNYQLSIYGSEKGEVDLETEAGFSGLDQGKSSERAKPDIFSLEQDKSSDIENSSSRLKQDKDPEAKAGPSGSTQDKRSKGNANPSGPTQDKSSKDNANLSDSTQDKTSDDNANPSGSTQDKTSDDNVKPSSSTQDEKSKDNANPSGPTQDKSSKDNANLSDSTQDKTSDDNANPSGSTQDKTSDDNVKPSGSTQDEKSKDNANPSGSTQDEKSKGKTNSSAEGQDKKSEAKADALGKPKNSSPSTIPAVSDPDREINSNKKSKQEDVWNFF